jgi:Ca2+-binding EF-hand superfamily protein
MMLRWIYIQLLLAHPAGFRLRFGEEMLEAFDLSRGWREHARLVFDGATSVARQWVLRSEFHQPWQTANAGPNSGDLITFQQIEPYQPSRAALVQGGIVALLLIAGVVNGINRGGGQAHSIPIGMQRPGVGLIKLNRSDFEGQPLIAGEKAKDEEDPLRAFLRSYGRIVHIVTALDAGGNLTIFPNEIEGAPAALRTLDLNHDGVLSPEECGFTMPGDLAADDERRARYAREFMHSNPVLAVLDADGDGRISSGEIANSATTLKLLDLDHNGTLSPYELLPKPATSEAAGVFGRFDIADGGMIAIELVAKDDPDAAQMKRLLAAADRNHDGLITRGELVIEFASIGEVERVRKNP